MSIETPGIIEPGQCLHVGPENDNLGDLRAQDPELADLYDELIREGWGPVILLGRCRRCGEYSLFPDDGSAVLFWQTFLKRTCANCRR